MDNTISFSIFRLCCLEVCIKLQVVVGGPTYDVVTNVCAR